MRGRLYRTLKRLKRKRVLDIVIFLVAGFASSRDTQTVFLSINSSVTLVLICAN
jgi:hypothetical protein